MKAPAQMPNISPFNPNMTPNFNYEKKFKAPQINIGANNGNNMGMMQRCVSF